MTLTVASPLVARLHHIIVSTSQKALGYITRMRHKAEERVASEDIDTFGYDLREASKVCNNGLKAEACLNTLMRGLQYQAIAI